ncbi:MAG: hypothetical protein HW404_2287, partial [Anaerolineales bacterium]|nr:hypothetical protein [Anaerolineales bacterium]
MRHQDLNADDDQHVVQHGQDGGHAVAGGVRHPAEGVGDVAQDAEHRQGDGAQRALADFGADRRADVLVAQQRHASGRRFERSQQLRPLLVGERLAAHDQVGVAGRLHDGAVDFQ